MQPGRRAWLGDRLGRLKPGLRGDVLVTTDRGGDPYRNLIESTERDVLFVAINGQPFYGTNELMGSAGAEHAESIEVGSLKRSIVLIYPDVPDADMGWSGAGGHRQGQARPRRVSGNREAPRNGKPPPWLMTDKPWDDPSHTKHEVPVTVEIPPLDPLTHDAAYFQAVKASPIHGGLLDPVANYYKEA